MYAGALLACAAASGLPLTVEEAEAEAKKAEEWGCKVWAIGAKRMRAYKPTPAYIQLRLGLLELRNSGII